MRSTISLTFDDASLNKFVGQCNALIKNVQTGSKRATTEACEEILTMSLKEVPRSTNTLSASAYYEVRRRTDVKGYYYEAVIGYGGNGDPINPETGLRASEYMLAVHENIYANHPIGKAKFLEDPVREYGEKYFKRAIVKEIKGALSSIKS